MIFLGNTYIIPVSKNGQITIPKRIREEMNLEEGKDKIKLTISRKGIEFKKAIRLRERPFFNKKDKLK
jgi:AbrB family looped-hinge helix DNA binding protein